LFISFFVCKEDLAYLFHGEIFFNIMNNVYIVYVLKEFTFPTFIDK